MNKITNYEISSSNKLLIGAAILRFNPLTQAALSDALLKTGNIGLRLLSPAISTLFVAVAALFVCKYAITYFLDSAYGQQLRDAGQKVAEVAGEALELGSEVAVKAAVVVNQAMEELEDVAARDGDNEVSLEGLGGGFVVVEEEDNGLSFLTNLFIQEEKQPELQFRRFEPANPLPQPEFPAEVELVPVQEEPKPNEAPQGDLGDSFIFVERSEREPIPEVKPHHQTAEAQRKQRFVNEARLRQLEEETADAAECNLFSWF